MAEEPRIQEGPGHDTWVLVAGTGRYKLPEEVRLAAAAVGEATARSGCGLVTGGWPGVDYLAAESFGRVVAEKGHCLEDRLVQVVREDRRADFGGGRIVETKVGALEWLEPQSFADAVVFIGGIGGTYGAFLSALHKGIPRFPLSATGGDAAKAFQHMCELWDVFPNPGISKSDFEALGGAIANAEEAGHVSERLLSLILQSVNHRRGRSPKSFFVSYSRHDGEWLQRIRLVLQPLEHQEHVRVWTDLDIEAGLPEPRLLGRRSVSASGGRRASRPGGAARSGGPGWGRASVLAQGDHRIDRRGARRRHEAGDQRGGE